MYKGFLRTPGLRRGVAFHVFYCHDHPFNPKTQSVMKHFLPYRQALLLAIATMISSPNLTAETVEVKTPGTLRQIMYQLDSPDISSLTISGALNSADLKYIADAQGDIANLKSIDLSNITLVPGGDAYATTRYGVAQIGAVTVHFYISDSEDHSYGGYSEWLGTFQSNENYYGDHLAGLFVNHKNLEYVKMPTYLKSIAPYTFHGCTSLKKVDFPSSIKEVSENAFSESGIETLTLPDGVKTIAPQAFRSAKLKNITLPESVDSIGYDAFYNTQLSTIDLSHVKKIGSYAFAGSTVSGKIDISEVDSIPAYLFQRTNITEVLFSGQLTTIGESAFENCNYLTSVPVVPSTLENVGKNAFKATPWLTSNDREDRVVYLNNIAYQFRPQTASSVLSFREGTAKISSCFVQGNDDTVREIVFPQSVTSIGEEAFWHMTSLKRVQWSENIKAIGVRAFYGCNSLGFDKLPDSIERIGQGAFSYCNNIFSLTLPKNLKWIDSYAFEGCSSITSCTLRSPNLSVARYVFCKNYGYNATLTDVIIGSEVEAVPDEFVYECYGINTVTFEDRPDEKPIDLGECCFNLYPKTIINCPKNMVNIGVGAFYAAIFPGEIPLEGTKHIAASAFRKIRGVTHLVIPESVEKIDEWAFSEIDDMTTVELRAPNLIADRAFGELSSRPLFPNYTIEKVIIGNNVEYLNRLIFNECLGLREIEFEARDVESYAPLQIGPYAFGAAYYCYEYQYEHNQIYDITIPYGTTKCCGSAFGYWIKTLTIPATLEEFTGGGPLEDLTEIHCYATVPPKGFDYLKLRKMYKDYKKVDVYVPEKSVETYRSDEAWGRCNIIGIPSQDELPSLNIDLESITDVYNLTGIRMPANSLESLPQGIYVIRYSSGKVRKIYKN